MKRTIFVLLLIFAERTLLYGQETINIDSVVQVHVELTKAYKLAEEKALEVKKIVLNITDYRRNGSIHEFNGYDNVEMVDLSGLDSDKMGIAATDMTEDSSKAEPGEADAVAKVETVMLNSVDARDMTASIRADYDNNRMVLLILSDGTEAAAKADDPAEWNKVIELGDTCSAEGEQILSRSGLEGWSFDVEILNDTCPQNALLTFADGECTYNARIAE